MAILRSSHKAAEAKSQSKPQPKSFKELVSQYTRAPVDPAVKMDMKNVRNHVPVFLHVRSPSTYSDFSSQFIMDTLIDQFELEETGRFRAVPSADDVIHILLTSLGPE